MRADSESETDILYARAQELKTQGINPYPHRFVRTQSLCEVNEAYEEVGCDGEGEAVALSLCGRVMDIHDDGGSILITIEDQDARLQLALDPTSLDPASLRTFRSRVYRGDYLGFEVDSVYREQGRMTARVIQWRFLALCMLPLPRRIADSARAYRQRYVHLAASIDARQRFVTRSQVLRYLRRFLEDEYGFLEVTTPRVQPVEHGGETSAFTTDMDAADVDAAVRVSTERYLKQLLVGGFERVYEIAQVMHNNPIDWLNYRECQVLHCGMVLADLEDMMRLTEQLIGGISKRLNATRVIPWQALEHLRVIAQRRIQQAQWENSTDNSSLPRAECDTDPLLIDFIPPWSRRSVYELVQDVTGVDFAAIHGIREAVDAARSAGAEMKEVLECASVSEVVMELIQQVVGPSLIQPTFLIYPSEEDSRLPAHRARPNAGKRFQLYINGLKFADGSSGWSDPLVYRTERSRQWQRRAQTRPEADMTDDDFLTALEYGLPPSGGVRVDIDRLVMLMTGATDIREVIYFPVCSR